MKLIELTQDRVAVVDDEDFEWLSKWKWYYHYHPNGNTGYARRTTARPQARKILMHIAIMERHQRWERGKEVDHENTCGCDNQKVNLRLATRKMNSINKKRQSNNTPKVAGVSWHKATGKWQARIQICKKTKHIGLFINKKDAIAARRQAEIEYFGEYRYDPTNVCPLGHIGECPDCAQRLEELE